MCHYGKIFKGFLCTLGVCCRDFEVAVDNDVGQIPYGRPGCSGGPFMVVSKENISYSTDSLRFPVVAGYRKMVAVPGRK